MGAISLTARIPKAAPLSSRVLRIGLSSESAPIAPHHIALLLNNGERPTHGINFGAVLSRTAYRDAVLLPPELGYLQSGDIIRLDGANGFIRVIYRKSSPHNVLFLTERCNSRCVMCSQPPREIDDGYLLNDLLEAIPLMARETPELCITGGEPTLNFPGVLKLVQSVKEHLPATSLHMLSNGRLFRYLNLAKEIAEVGHPDFMIGIPLYADTATQHDFVVQASGAFEETMEGLVNLGRVRQPIEIRFVIHQQTVDRMVQTARFIRRNLPFVAHVTLMGIEPMGFARTNWNALWIDPTEYAPALEEAITELRMAGMRTSIYNHPLCLLPRSLWSYARKSISDWKNIYLPECQECAVRTQCAGLFASASIHHSKHIHPLFGGSS